jgi:hypothetical protein
LPEGRAPEVAPEQLAVVREPVFESDEDSPVVWDADFAGCGRTGTDVIVQGSAISRDGPRRELEVSVSVHLGTDKRGDAEKLVRRIRVFGDRKVHWYEGAVFFTEATPFEKMPITYTRAYGGKDHGANERRPNQFARGLANLADRPVEDFSPYEYPRNNLGRGYVVFPDREALDGLLLPNLEWAGDLLTPERLALGNAKRWPTAPRPACFDFTHQDFFPRTAFLGLTPDFEGKPEDVAEVREGYLPASLLRVDFFEHVGSPDAARFFHGAAPWLVFPDFDGDEIIRVKNMHPTLAEQVIPMPAERPHILLEPHTGGTSELEPALRTIVLRPDKEELILLWVGTLAVDRPPTEAQYNKMRHAVRWRKGPWGTGKTQ